MSDFSRNRIDELNKRRLEKVEPVLVKKVLHLIEMVRADNNGYDLLITCGFRSIAEQNRLFAQGRTKPGKIVTKARGGESKHNFGKAVDFAVIEKGKIVWDVPFYKKTIGKYAQTVGVSWGGNWKSFKDYPHVEL